MKFLVLSSLLQPNYTSAYEVQGLAYYSYLKGDLSFPEYCSMYYRCEQIMNHHCPV